MKKFYGLALALLAGSMALWGCKNNNLFGGMRKEGSGNTATVMSDAQAALANKEFNNALAYFEKVLAKDPNNAEALYGAAAASFGSAGLDLGQLLANIVNTQQNAAPSGSLSDALMSARVAAGASVSVDANSILYNLNLEGMRNNLNKTICYLLRIRTGRSDGAIARDKINILVALTVTTTLRTVLRAIDKGLLDIRKSDNGKDFSVTVTADNATLSAACSDGTMAKILDDFSIALQSLQEAVVKISPESGSTVDEMKADLQSAFNEMKADVLAIAPSCSNPLDNYNVSNLSAPTSDPGDCLSMGTCCN